MVDDEKFVCDLWGFYTIFPVVESILADLTGVNAVKVDESRNWVTAIMAVKHDSYRASQRQS